MADEPKGIPSPTPPQQPPASEPSRIHPVADYFRKEIGNVKNAPFFFTMCLIAGGVVCYGLFSLFIIPGLKTQIDGLTVQRDGFKEQFNEASKKYEKLNKEIISGGEHIGTDSELANIGTIAKTGWTNTFQGWAAISGVTGASITQTNADGIGFSYGNVAVPITILLEGGAKINGSSMAAAGPIRVLKIHNPTAVTLERNDNAATNTAAGTSIISSGQNAINTINQSGGSNSMIINQESAPKIVLPAEIRETRKDGRIISDITFDLVTAHPVGHMFVFAKHADTMTLSPNNTLPSMSSGLGQNGGDIIGESIDNAISGSYTVSITHTGSVPLQWVLDNVPITNAVLNMPSIASPAK